jgi:hypothetical protein
VLKKGSDGEPRISQEPVLPLTEELKQIIQEMK